MFWLRRVLISLVTSLKENPHPFLKMADDEVGYLLHKGTVWGDSVKIRHGIMHMDAQCIFEWMTSLADGRNIALWTEMRYIPYSRQASSREAPPWWKKPSCYVLFKWGGRNEMK